MAVWGWGASSGAEEWEGPFATREEAEERGHEHADTEENPAALGVVAEATLVDPASLARDAVDMDALLECINEDESCSWADDPAVEAIDHKAAESALRDVIESWADAHLTANGRFVVTGQHLPVRPRAQMEQGE